MEALQPSPAEIMGDLPRIIGMLGGIAGIGTAVAALLMWVYRRGYDRGREIERSRHQNQVIERLSAKLAKKKG